MARIAHEKVTELSPSDALDCIRFLIEELRMSTDGHEVYSYNDLKSFANQVMGVLAETPQA